MSIDYTAGRFWLAVWQILSPIGVGIYAWVSNKQKAHTRALAEAEKTIAKLDARIIKLESSAITHKELGKVYDRINEVSEQVGQISGSIKGIGSAVDRIQEHLLNNGGQ